MCTVNIGPVTRIDPLEPAPPHAAHFLIIPDPACLLCQTENTEWPLECAFVGISVSIVRVHAFQCAP